MVIPEGHVVFMITYAYLLFNKFLSGSSNISNFSVRHRLQRYEVGHRTFQHISGFSHFVFKLQYSVESLVSCFHNGTLYDFLRLL